MSADRLREAAKVLRERANLATDGQWRVTHDPLGVHVENGEGRGRIAMSVGSDRDEYGEADANYIATMHPGVGLALADWLDESAHVVEVRGDGVPPTLARLADLILGGAS